MKPSRALLPLSLCLVALASVPARADRLDAAVALGQTATAAVAAPGDVATVGFTVTAGIGRKLVFTLKNVKGSKLVPDVKLIAPDGTTYDPAAHGGSAATAATKWSAKLPDVPQTGLWRIEVRGKTNSVGSFTVLVKGKDVAKAAGNATILVNGRQDVEIIGGDNVTVTVSAKRSNGNKTIVPQLVILDPNNSPLNGGSAVATGSTKTGALSLKAFRLPVMGKYTLRFSGTANTGGSIAYSAATAPAKIKKTGVPTANPGAAFEVEPGFAGALAGSGTAGAGGQLSFRWVQVSGPAVTLVGPNTAQPTFTAPVLPANAKVVSLGFQLAVTEGVTVSKVATVGVEVARRPIADAGRSQSVASNAAVTLGGSGSFDRRGSGLLFTWRQIAGDTATVTLAGGTTTAPTFTAPGSGVHALHFGLTVDDGNARSFEDVVVVNVGDTALPVADAGREQYVSRMSNVHLSGLASLTASGVLSSPLAWTQVSGPTVTLAGSTTAFPSFTAPRTAGDLVFELNVGGTGTTVDRVAVRVRPDETNFPAPAKGNGPLVGAPGAVALSASATTDPNNTDTLAFRWAQTSGPAAPVSDANTAAATATTSAGNNLHVFAVQANDGLQYGAPDLVSVRNTGYNGLPIANAGIDRSIDLGVANFAAQLNGGASLRTDGGNGLTFQWTQISGKDWFDVAASLPTFNPTSAAPSYTIPAGLSSLTRTRTVVFQLVVNDGTNDSHPDFVSVTYSNLPLNGKPAVTAGASDLNPIVGATVTLQGSAVDLDGDPMTFKWTQTAGTPVPLSPNANVLSPTFVAIDATAPFVFQLVANDGFEDGTPKTVSVTVDRKPVANIVMTPGTGSGPIGTNVTLNGTASSDTENQAGLTYLWSQVSGNSIGAFNATASSISFSAPSGAVAMRLVVNDGRQNSDPANATFTAGTPITVAPSASASSAGYGATVTLNANAAGGSGPLSYTWRQINPIGADPTCALSSTSSAGPNFSVPLPTMGPFGATPSATFGVRASDATTQSSEQTVTITFFASLNNAAGQAGVTSVYGNIISANCLSCHGGTANTCSGGSAGSGNFSTYGMGSKTAFLTNSRGAGSCASSKTRLPTAGLGPNAGNSGNSYFNDRINGIGGSTMPTTGSLTTTQKNIIADWINQGVLDN